MVPVNLDWFFAPLLANWEGISGFFNSVFFTSIVGASFGAYYGAKAAQDTAEKSKRREQLTKEIRDTNAAMTVAASICGSMLNIRKQFIGGIREEFDKNRSEFLEHIRRHKAGELPPGEVYEFRADLQTITFPQLPIQVLQKIVFERISVVGRPLNLATILGQSISDLQSSIALRNSLIEGFKHKGPPLNAKLYFGLREGDVVNEEFPSSIYAMSRQSEDCIFFAHLLVKDLMEHGHKIASVFTKELGKGAPRVSVQDFSDAAKDGLMPNDDDYSDWFKKFKKHEDPPTLGRRGLAWVKSLTKGNEPRR